MSFPIVAWHLLQQRATTEIRLAGIGDSPLYASIFFFFHNSAQPAYVGIKKKLKSVRAAQRRQ